MVGILTAFSLKAILFVHNHLHSSYHFLSPSLSLYIYAHLLYWKKKKENWKRERDCNPYSIVAHSKKKGLKRLLNSHYKPTLPLGKWMCYA